MTAAPLAMVSGLLQEIGFKKRAGAVFTREVSKDVIGWLGLNTASRHTEAGQVEVNPVVGIRHQGIERTVAQLRGEKFHEYQPPTVSIPLGYLMPGARYLAWTIGGSDAGDRSSDLVASVARFGVPFVEGASSVPELCSLIERGFGFEHQLVYRHPVAWALLGDLVRAHAVLDSAEAALGERTDAAAAELRAFGTAFRDRFGVSSSG